MDTTAAASLPNELNDLFTNVLPSFWDKILLMVIVLGLAALLSYLTRKFIRRALKADTPFSSSMPSASIFSNIVKAFIWVTAIGLILKPVFGLDPNSLITALGVGGIAVSLGLQPTIANLISGLQLTMGKIISPGDHVRINDVEGTVRDISWRETTVVDRLDNTVMVPNSLLNTSALEKVPSSVESSTSFPFTMKRGIDLDKACDDMARTVQDAIQDVLVIGTDVDIALTGFTPEGVRGEAWIHVMPGVPFGGVKDRAIRALYQKEYLADSQHITVTEAPETSRTATE